jgi:hypothetical protein
MVVARLGGLPQPSRAEKRNAVELAKWYRRHWAAAEHWLAAVQLRDEADRPIDAFRELAEKGLI